MGATFFRSAIYFKSRCGWQLWHQLYALNSYTTWIKNIIKTEDIAKSYVSFGQIQPNNNGLGYGYINKFDSLGNEIWSRVVSYAGFNQGFFYGSNAPNNHYIACGAARYDFMHANQNNPSSKGWLVYFDKDGNEKWNRLLSHDTLVDTEGYLYKIVTLKDGNFIAAGFSSGFDSLGRWKQDGWLVKVDSLGCLYSGCAEVGIPNPKLVQDDLKLYPNPGTGIFFLESQTVFPKNTTVVLLDNLGKKIKTLDSPAGKTKIKYNLQGLPPNNYYVLIHSGGKTYRKKITLIL